MRIVQRSQQYHDWFPVPDQDSRIQLWRWMLLEGNRIAVAGVLLTFVYVSLLSVGILWPFEIQVLLTEASTVENILETFLSGIILLVSIVVSINSIVLSQDMTSVDEQERRIRGTGEFWQDVNELTESTECQSDLKNFLEAITTMIKKNAESVATSTDTLDPDFHDQI